MSTTENGGLTMPVGIETATTIARNLASDFDVLAGMLADRAIEAYRSGRDIAGANAERCADHYDRLARDMRWLVCDEKTPPF